MRSAAKLAKWSRVIITSANSMPGMPFSWSTEIDAAFSSIIRDDKAPPTAAIFCLAGQYARCGYRRVTALLRAEIFHVNLKRVWIELLNEQLLLLAQRG